MWLWKSSRKSVEIEHACSHLTVLGSRYVCVYHKTNAGDKVGTIHFTIDREVYQPRPVSKTFTALLECVYNLEFLF